MTSYLLLMGKSVHTQGHLGKGSHSEWNARVNAVMVPQLKGGEMVTPGPCCGINMLQA